MEAPFYIRTRSAIAFQRPAISKQGGANRPYFGRPLALANHTRRHWVFPSPRNAGAHIQDFGKAFEKAAKQAGLTGITPYRLRHTFATELDGKAKGTIVSKLLGHSRERHSSPYLHADWNEKVAAIEALPVPANFTALVGMWEGGPEADEGQVQVPQELVMVGPWGLEPQTSTVSR